MKRELGIARCGLACCLCSEIHTVQAVIQDNVRIRTGARIETVQWKRESATAMDAVKTAVKAYWPRLSRMGSVCSPNSMGKNSFLIAWKQMRRPGWFITAKG